MKHVSETDHPFPDQIEHYYGCNVCLDRGCVTEERETKHGDTALYSIACRFCEYGSHWSTMQAKSIVDRERYVEVPNRKLRWE